MVALTKSTEFSFVQTYATNSLSILNTGRLLSNATLAMVQAIISGVVLFILYRYLITHLGVKQLGLWSVVLASTSVARLTDMGLTGSVVKYVARYSALKDDKQVAEVIHTAAISIAVVMAAFCIAIYPLMDNVLSLVIPTEAMPQATQILPWAMYSLWFASVGGVFQSGLDGCQRMDIRNILTIFSNGIYLLAAFWLVPHFGLIGLAIGQSAQGFLLMLASWLTLRHQLKSLPFLPILWRKSKFTEMFGYSVNFQINSISILLFDPVIKLLMSRYGGLSVTAYYEMASQLVIKLRGLLVSATQALVPAIAELHETAPERVREIYLKAYRMNFFVTIPLYGAILIILPLVSELWIGHIENIFLFFGAVLTVGWGLNTLISPAYFVNLGTGDLKLNSIFHVMMALLNAILGLIMGPVYGGFGVAFAAMFALALSSGILIFILNKQYKIPFENLLPSEHHLMIVVVIACVIFSGLFTLLFYLSHNYLLIGTVNITVYILILMVLVWVHPYKRILFDRRKFEVN